VILVDTSVWVEHLRQGTVGLDGLLLEGRVVCHPFIVGELACGNLQNRSEILALLQELPRAIEAAHQEVMNFIENNGLMGQGLGFIDLHLLASARLTGIPIWTLDKRLKRVATKLRLIS
jgi:predicted nucleic acid-binding protein